MAFTLNVPTISQALSPLFNMKIYEQGNPSNTIKCTIMDLQETLNYNTPKEPIDSGEYIGDTLYKMPKGISCRVFVNTNFLDSFNNSIETIQNKSGFCIVGLDNQKYENMRIDSISSAQTADVQGGYFFNIAFSEVILIDSFSASIPLSKLQKASYASKQSLGEKSNSQARKQSILYKIAN